MPELGLNETPGADPSPDAIAALCRAHPGATGMALISSDTAAFQARRVLARTARHSLDLMYYIWEEDLTGRLLFGEVLAAADRGVKVRLLLDDIGFTSLDRLLQALDSHPNISVRLFNPTRAPKGSLRRGVELGLRLFSMTRRMHNKAWIADGETAILGGRNIGDAYFGASRASNFHDLDLAVLGPVVAEAAVMFQEYWTSEPTHPVRPPLNPIRRRKILNGLRSFGVSAEAKTYLDRLPTLAWPPDEAGLRWCREAHLVADPPEKALGRKGQNWLMASLLPRLEAARERIAIISPYFVPGQNGTRRLCDLAEKGIHISILTNSLSATDVAAVHGAYARYRKPLLRAGIRLYELRAIARLRRLSLRGRTNASLHTKAFIIDGQTGFVGSLNFDPRSASLNTEMGVLFTEPGLVAGIQHIFTAETAPGISHALELDISGRILWHGTSGSPHRRDPGVSPARRALSWFMGRLPLESQL
jgi:putative cardiolipin synthase